MLPRPSESSMRKKRIDHAGGNGNLSMASVKTTNARPVPSAAWNTRQLKKENFRKFTTQNTTKKNFGWNKGTHLGYDGRVVTHLGVRRHFRKLPGEFVLQQLQNHQIIEIVAYGKRRRIDLLQCIGLLWTFSGRLLSWQISQGIRPAWLPYLWKFNISTHIERALRKQWRMCKNKSENYSKLNKIQIYLNRIVKIQFNSTI